MQRTPALGRYAARHCFLLIASTLCLIVYLFLVTLVDGWGSRFGNGLGGGLAMLVWLGVPTLSVARRFGVQERRGMTLPEVCKVALPASLISAAPILWIGVGMRSDRPDVRLGDGAFWTLHIGYIVAMFAFFAGVMWLRARVEARGLSNRGDQDTPPPS